VLFVLEIESVVIVVAYGLDIVSPPFSFAVQGRIAFATEFHVAIETPNRSRILQTSITFLRFLFERISIAYKGGRS